LIAARFGRLGSEAEEAGDGFPKTAGIEACLLGDMRSGRLPAKDETDLGGAGVGGKTKASTSLNETGGGRASVIGAK